MTHVRTLPYYPQSNGKLGRWHKTLKSDAIRPASPSSPEDARRVVVRFVDHYNRIRLHSALGYIAPNDFLEGRSALVWQQRDQKLEYAREQRRLRRAAAVSVLVSSIKSRSRRTSLAARPLGSGVEPVASRPKCGH
ncbi:MAG: transposase [Polyangiaceae bacterium]|nr:transposase [Polyangiaceae bacterium]